MNLIFVHQIDRTSENVFFVTRTVGGVLGGTEKSFWVTFPPVLRDYSLLRPLFYSCSSSVVLSGAPGPVFSGPEPIERWVGGGGSYSR